MRSAKFEGIEKYSYLAFAQTLIIFHEINQSISLKKVVRVPPNRAENIQFQLKRWQPSHLFLHYVYKLGILISKQIRKRIQWNDVNTIIL